LCSWLFYFAAKIYKERKVIFNPFMREHFMPVLRPLDLICVASAKKRDTLVNITLTGIDQFEPFSATFPNGKDPKARDYRE